MHKYFKYCSDFCTEPTDNNDKEILKEYYKRRDPLSWIFSWCEDVVELCLFSLFVWWLASQCGEDISPLVFLIPIIAVYALIGIYAAIRSILFSKVLRTALANNDCILKTMNTYTYKPIPGKSRLLNFIPNKGVAITLDVESPRIVLDKLKDGNKYIFYNVRDTYIYAVCVNKN